MINYKNYIFFIFSLLFFTNCKSLEKLNLKEQVIVEKSIDTIMSDGVLGKKIKDCYIVDSYMNAPSLDNFSENSQNIFFKKIDADKFKTYHIKKSGILKADLIDYSSCKKSEVVLTFSNIIEEHIIFIELYISNKEMNIKRIKKTSPHMIFNYIIIFDKKNDIDEIIEGGVIYN